VLQITSRGTAFWSCLPHNRHFWELCLIGTLQICRLINLTRLTNHHSVQSLWYINTRLLADPARDGFLLVLQSLLLLVQFLKLETDKVFAGRRSRRCSSSATTTSVDAAMVSMSHHLTVLLRLLLMVMMLFWWQVRCCVMHLSASLLLLLLLLGMTHQRVSTKPHRRLTNVSRYMVTRNKYGKYVNLYRALYREKPNGLSRDCWSGPLRWPKAGLQKCFSVGDEDSIWRTTTNDKRKVGLLQKGGYFKL